MRELPALRIDTHLLLTMKNEKPKSGLSRLFVALILLALPFLQQCTQDKNLVVEPISPTTGNEVAVGESDGRIASIKLQASTPYITANGKDTLVLSPIAYNRYGLRIETAGFVLYHNNRKISQQDFATTEAGEHAFVARLGQLSSDTLTVEARHEDAPVASVARIELLASSQLIIADGKSAATFTANFYGADGQLLEPKESWALYANDNVLSAERLTTATPGELRVFAKTGDIVSNEIIITARQDKRYEVVTIPVVLHIGHFGEAVGTGANIPPALVQEIIDELNRGYANELGARDPNAVDMRVRFRLAQSDERGKPLAEPGVIRSHVGNYDNGTGNNTASNRALGLAEWRAWQEAAYLDPTHYYNIWLYPAEENWAGLANYPSVRADQALAGITGFEAARRPYFISTHFNMPSPRINTKHRTAMIGTIIHEVGHTLGLRHTFSENNCASSDYCEDTYSYNYPTPNQPCPDNKGAMVANENFMDYRGSRNTFTYDQRERVQHALKNSLWFPELSQSRR